MAAARKLALGVFLLLLTSSALLLSDLDHRNAGALRRGRIHKWKIYFVEFNDVLDVKESEQGVRDGLIATGLQPGRDYDITVLNAQGDMATVSALVDAAVTGGADMLITFSTPTLQAAIRRAGSVPVVFTYVASAIAAGAGKSETDHLPNLTGMTVMPGYDETLELIQKYFPGLHRLGSLYVPAETNMLAAKAALDAAAGRHRMETVYVPVNTATDVPDAAAALMSRNVDAVLQLPGNLTASAFGSISSAARQARVPIFAFQKVQAQGGALIVMGRDYSDAGHATAAMAARVMRGEKPASIPLRNFDQTHIIVNLEAARELRIEVPPALLKSAHEVIGAGDGHH
jgi:ABC-type uncharacterized transport system substrate-binding protein